MGPDANGICVCKPGFTFSGSICNQCSAGTYKDSFGNAPCTSCPANTYSFSGAMQCIPCGENTESGTGSPVCFCKAGFQPNGMAKCQACNAGTFKSLSGNASCIPCFAGTSASSPGQSTCLPCPDGSYSSINGALVCISCGINATSNGTGSTTCYCPPDTYGTPTMSCTSCPVNYVRSGFSSITTSNLDCVEKPKCIAGYYGTIGGTSANCIACPINTFRSGAAYTNTSSCLSCPANSVTTTIASTSIDSCLCKAGYTKQSDACVACPVGFVKNTLGNEQCNACQPNTYSAVTASTVCLLCGPNAFSLSGSASCSCIAGHTPSNNNCIPCSAGFFKTEISNVTCSSCASNTYSSFAGAISCNECGTGGITIQPSATSCVCAAGYFGNGTSCSKCEVNTFKASHGNETCAKCPDGNFSSPGSSGCASCGPGSSFDVASSMCLCQPGYEPKADSSCGPCPLGKSKAVLSNGTCTSCAGGSFSSVVGATSCLSCPMNFVSTEDASACVCRPGYELVSGSCSPCIAGFYKSSAGNASCVRCDAGSYSSTQASIECTTCAANMTSTSQFTSCACAVGYGLTNSVCLACAPGEYKNTTGNAKCSNCLAGTYSSIFGASDCSVCPANSSSLAKSSSCTCMAGYQSVNSNCVACAENTYKQLADNSSCIACVTNSITNGIIGANSASACLCKAGFGAISGTGCNACAPGTFKNSVENTVCTPCAPGYFQPSSGAITCQICPQGFFQAKSGQTSCDPCEAGRYSNVTGASNSTFCQVCPIDSFSSSNSSSCTSCGEGATTLGRTGSISLANCTCLAGYEFNGASCVKCPVNKYKNTIGNTRCLPCGTSANTNNEEGSETCYCPDDKYGNPAVNCVQCNTNTFKVGYTSSITDASVCTNEKLCRAGYYGDPNVNCTKCPKHTYKEQPTTSVTLEDACILCSNGWQTIRTGSTSPEDCQCPPGLEPSSASGGSQCRECEIGYAKLSVGNSPCDQCQPGTTTSKTGSKYCDVSQSQNNIPTINEALVSVITNVTEDTPKLIKVVAVDVDTNNILTFYVRTPPANGTLEAYLGPDTTNSRGDVYTSQNSAILNYKADSQNDLVQQTLESREISFYYVPRKNFVGSDSFAVYARDDRGGQSKSVTIYVAVSNVNDPPMFSSSEKTFLVPSTFVAAGIYSLPVISASDADYQDTVMFRLHNVSAMARHMDVIRDSRTAAVQTPIQLKFYGDSQLQKTVTLDQKFIAATNVASEWFRGSNRTQSGEYELRVDIDFGTSGGSLDPFLVFFLEATDGSMSSLMKIIVNVECASGTYPNIWSQGKVCQSCPTGGLCSLYGTRMPYNKMGYSPTSISGVFVACMVDTACLAGEETSAIGIEFVASTTELKFTQNNQVYYSSYSNSTSILANAMGLNGISCASGYQGDYCNDCQSPGYYRKDKKFCEKCQPNQLSFEIILVIFVAVVMVAIVLLLLISKIPKLDTGNVGIGITFFQILAIFNDIPQISWPETTLKVLHFASFFNFELEAISPECLVQDSFKLTYELKLQAILALPIVLTMNIIIVFCVRAVYEFFKWLLFRGRRSKTSLGKKVTPENTVMPEKVLPKNSVMIVPQYYGTKQPTRMPTIAQLPKAASENGDSNKSDLYNFGIMLAGIWLSLLNSLYLTLSMKSLEIFNCIDLDPNNPDVRKVIANETSAKCYDDKWRQLLPFALTGIGLYAVGILLVFLTFHYIAYRYDDELQFRNIFDVTNETDTKKLREKFDEIYDVQRGKNKEIGSDREELYALLGLDSESEPLKTKKPAIKSAFVQFIVDVSRRNKSSYSKYHRYWDIVALLRKMLITLSATFIVGSVPKCLALQVIFSIALFFQLKARPFAKPSWNRLEEIVLYSIQLVLIGALTLYQDVTKDEDIRNILGIVIVSVVIACASIIFGLSLIEVKRLFFELREHTQSKLAETESDGGEKSRKQAKGPIQVKPVRIIKQNIYDDVDVDDYTNDFGEGNAVLGGEEGVGVVTNDGYQEESGRQSRASGSRPASGSSNNGWNGQPQVVQVPQQQMQMQMPVPEFNQNMYYYNREKPIKSSRYEGDEFGRRGY